MSLDGSEFPQKGNSGSTAKIYRRRRSGRVGAKGGEADSALAGEDRLALRGKRWGKGLHDGRGGTRCRKHDGMSSFGTEAFIPHPAGARSLGAARL